MGLEFCEIRTDENLGKADIHLEAIKDIVTISTLKIKGVYPNKKENDMVSVKIKDNHLIVNIYIKLLEGLDIATVCNNIQKDVMKNVEVMAGVSCHSVNININGFKKENDD